VSPTQVVVQKETKLDNINYGHGRAVSNTVRRGAEPPNSEEEATPEKNVADAASGVRIYSYMIIASRYMYGPGAIIT
jgi:hypothetical protein